MRKLLILLLLTSFAFSQSAKVYWLGNEPDSKLSADEVQSLATFAEELYAGTITVTDMSIDTLDVERVNFTSAETGHSIYIDRDMAFSEIGDNYPSGIYIDLEQTDDVGSGAWNAQGGFYGLNSRIHVDDNNTGGYAVLGRAYIDSDETINDVYGIMGEIRLTGTASRGASTSSIAGLRSSISNLSTGTWDGQMYGLMLDFGANMNFGDESALIFGYSHGDAYLDYGMHLSSKSTTQAMTAGVYIEAETGSTVTAGIDFDGAGTFTYEISGQNDGTIDNATNGSWDFGAADLIATGGDITGANGNAIDIGEAADGTITFSRDDSGAMILTSADDNADADLTIVPGGTGNLLLGDAGGTTQIASSDWTISTIGDMTNMGAISADGLLTLTSVLIGLDIDGTSAGADANYMSADIDFTQGSVAGGAYLSRGNITGVRSDVNAIGNLDHAWAFRGGSSMAMAADSETNQFYGGIISAAASGAHTLTLHDGLVGLQATVTVDAGVTDVTGGLVAALFTNSQPIGLDVSSPTYNIYAKVGGYTDYGIAVQVEANNTTSGIRIQASESAVLPTGLEISTNTGTVQTEIELSSGANIFTGSAVDGNAIYAQVGAYDAVGSIYLSTNGTLWVQDADAGAGTDWEVVTVTNDD